MDLGRQVLAPVEPDLPRQGSPGGAAPRAGEEDPVQVRVGELPLGMAQERERQGALVDDPEQHAIEGVARVQGEERLRPARRREVALDRRRVGEERVAIDLDRRAEELEVAAVRRDVEEPARKAAGREIVDEAHGIGRRREPEPEAGFGAQRPVVAALDGPGREGQRGACGGEGARPARRAARPQGCEPARGAPGRPGGREPLPQEGRRQENCQGHVAQGGRPEQEAQGRAGHGEARPPAPDRDRGQGSGADQAPEDPEELDVPALEERAQGGAKLLDALSQLAQDPGVGGDEDQVVEAEGRGQAPEERRGQQAAGPARRRPVPRQERRRAAQADEGRPQHEVAVHVGPERLEEAQRQDPRPAGPAAEIPAHETVQDEHREEEGEDLGPLLEANPCHEERRQRRGKAQGREGADGGQAQPQERAAEPERREEQAQAGDSPQAPDAAAQELEEPIAVDEAALLEDPLVGGLEEPGLPDALPEEEVVPDVGAVPDVRQQRSEERQQARPGDGERKRRRVAGHRVSGAGGSRPRLPRAGWSSRRRARG